MTKLKINFFFMTNSIFRSRHNKGGSGITSVGLLSETFNLCWLIIFLPFYSKVNIKQQPYYLLSLQINIPPNNFWLG